MTNTQLYRHGTIAGHIRSALDRPGPGETLQKYAAVVTRHATATWAQTVIVAGSASGSSPWRAVFTVL